MHQNRATRSRRLLLASLLVDALDNQVKLVTGDLAVEPLESPASNVYAPANDNASPTSFGAGWNWIQADERASRPHRQVVGARDRQSSAGTTRIVVTSDHA